MNIYLDENISSGFLAGFLSKQGHSVIRPIMVGLLGASDAVQLEFAVREQLIVLTSDADDFSELHELILTAGGKHPGIMVIRYDKDSSHAMKPKHIATAVGKVEKLGTVLTNQFIVLNQWR